VVSALQPRTITAGLFGLRRGRIPGKDPPGRPMECEEPRAALGVEARAQIGVDAQTGITHTAVTTPANTADVIQAVPLHTSLT